MNWELGLYSAPGDREKRPRTLTVFIGIFHRSNVLNSEICSFYKNGNLKNAIHLHISCFRNLRSNCSNNLVFSALGTSDLSKFINMKIL